MLLVGWLMLVVVVVVLVLGGEGVCWSREMRMAQAQRGSIKI